MDFIKGKTYDEERAFYGSKGARLIECRFDGEADGESAFKESADVGVCNCYFNLRYPFWHDVKVEIDRCELTEKCRAALWYTRDILVRDSKLGGIKALRECEDVAIYSSEINSTEFGWSSKNIHLKDTKCSGEYFMLRAEDMLFEEVELQGKYSFQYIKNSSFKNCNFNTKDAFWHAKGVYVKDSVIRGEYLAWYAEDITFENCKIIGTQPFCYCKGLKLINCEMEGCDLSFERSFVEATVTTEIDSIKNPYGGFIEAPSVKEIILDDESALCRITLSYSRV